MSVILHKAMDRLKEMLLQQRISVENAIARSISLLKQHDSQLVKAIVEGDREIDRAEVEIEEECLRILLLHQPVAKDLRFLVSVFKINTSIERMGDYAANIAKRSFLLLDERRADLSLNLYEMAKQAKLMVTESLDAFFDANAELAQRVCADDRKVDAMRRFFHETIIQEIKNNPQQVESLIELSSLVRHFERLGDMATHVAEEAIYLAQGDIVRHAS